MAPPPTKTTSPTTAASTTPAPTPAGASSQPAANSTSSSSAAATDSDANGEDDVFNQDIWSQNLEDVGKDTMQDLIWEGEESYVAQVKETVKIIQDAITARDLPTISKQGHFLKGSSATIGLAAVPASCEKLQNLGKGKDEEGLKKISDDEALSRCEKALEELKKNHKKANARLEAWRAEDD